MSNMKKYSFGDLVISYGGLIILAISVVMGLLVYFFIIPNDLVFRGIIATGLSIVFYFVAMSGYYTSVNEDNDEG